MEQGDIYDSERDSAVRRVSINAYRMGWSNLPSSSISLRLRDSLRLDGGVNIVNIAFGSPVRHFASRKTGDTSYRERRRRRGAHGERRGREFCEEDESARKRKRETVDGMGQSRGSSEPVKLNYAGSAAKTKLLARI